MTPRKWLTPSTTPAETICRPLFIPDDRAWLGAINGALLLLTNPYNWEQLNPTDLTPDQAADRAYQLLQMMWGGACEADFMDVRQDPASPCILEKTTDGTTWIPWANLQSCPPALRFNANKQRYEFSDDGGVTWEDVPIATPTGGTPAVQWPSPTARTEADKACVAARNAVLVLKQFYHETWDAFVNNITGTVIGIAQALASLAEGLGGLIGLEWSIDLASEAWENSAQFTEGGFTTAVEDDLLCILYCNATVQPDNTVTFDYAQVRSEVAAKYTSDGSPWGGINALLWYIGESGLNVAGGVKATDTAVCTGCDCDPNWCYEYDFAINNGGFVRRTVGGNWWGGVYQNGRWESSVTGVGGGYSVSIRKTFTTPLPNVFKVEFDYTRTRPLGGGETRDIAINVNGGTGWTISQNTGPQSGTMVWTGGPLSLNSLMVGTDTEGVNALSTITAVRIYGGPGDNPLGEDNC